jgi:hypothetical protein
MKIAEARLHGTGGKSMRAPRFLLLAAATLVFGTASGRAEERSSAEQPANAKSLAVPLAPAGQVNRYRIPNYTSETLRPGTRSFVEVTIENNSNVTCNAAVSFQFAFGTSDICVISLAIPSKQSRIFCSRPVSDPLAPCSISCPGSGLTFNTGHANVSSTNTAECSQISVDAQQFFTRDPSDTLVESESKLTVTNLTRNNGD